MERFKEDGHGGYCSHILANLLMSLFVNCSLGVMGLGETLHLSSHKYTGPLSIVKIAKVCTVVVVKGEKCLCK